MKALEKVGLTKDQVIKLSGLPVFGDVIATVTSNNYLCGTDQRRIRKRMKAYKTFIMARFLEGWHPGTISRLLSVSEESVRVVLRKNKLFGTGKAGRPSKSETSLQGILS
jgi:hypothetical protein